MTRSLMQAWYQSPKKRIILDQSSNSPWTPPGVSRFVLFGPSKIGRSFVFLPRPALNLGRVPPSSTS